MKLGQEPMEVDMIATEHVTEIILGWDWLHTMGAIWNFQMAEVMLRGQYFSLESWKSSGWCRQIICREDVVIPARSEVLVPGKVVYHRLSAVTEAPDVYWGTQPTTSTGGARIPGVLVSGKQTDVPMRVLNTSNSNMQLCASERLGVLCEVDVVCSAMDFVNNSDDDKYDEVIDDLVNGTSDEV